MDSTIYGKKELTVIDTDLDPRVQQDMIVNGAIVANPDYIAPTAV